MNINTRGIDRLNIHKEILETVVFDKRIKKNATNQYIICTVHEIYYQFHIYFKLIRSMIVIQESTYYLKTYNVVIQSMNIGLAYGLVLAIHSHHNYIMVADDVVISIFPFYLTKTFTCENKHQLQTCHLRYGYLSFLFQKPVLLINTYTPCTAYKIFSSNYQK